AVATERDACTGSARLTRGAPEEAVVHRGEWLVALRRGGGNVAEQRELAAVDPASRGAVMRENALDDLVLAPAIALGIADGDRLDATRRIAAERRTCA